MGWILMEFKSGVTLDQVFWKLSEVQKENVISQIAEVFSFVQGACLPDTVISYGGLTINDEGVVVSGQMTSLRGGPWATHAELLRARLVSALDGADESAKLDGWMSEDVRERVDAFVTTGLENKLRDAGVDGTHRFLVHADLAITSILFDAENGRITGLIDFDFSEIGHPFEEFQTSFELGGDVCPGGTLWEKALEEKGVLQPKNMRGVDTLGLLGELGTLIAPFELVHPVVLVGQTEEQIRERREKTEKELLECLDALGA